MTVNVGATFPYVWSASALAPRAHDVARSLAPDTVRVCSFTDTRDWENLAGVDGVRFFIVRPKWHHGRGKWREIENVLDAREWDGEQSLRDILNWLKVNGYYFMLEGPNEPDIECFPDLQTGAGLWYAEDPEIYIPEAYYFREWWLQQMDIIQEAFPDIVFASCPVSAGNLDRSMAWMDILRPITDRCQYVNAHWYWWHEDEGTGSLYDPAWGGQIGWIHEMHPDHLMIISEANCNAMLEHIEIIRHYPHMLDIANQHPFIHSLCFFELPSSPGQEQHALDYSECDAVLSWRIAQVAGDAEEARVEYEEHVAELEQQMKDTASPDCMLDAIRGEDY